MQPEVWARIIQSLANTPLGGSFHGGDREHPLWAELGGDRVQVPPEEASLGRRGAPSGRAGCASVITTCSRGAEKP